MQYRTKVTRPGYSNTSDTFKVKSSWHFCFVSHLPAQTCTTGQLKQEGVTRSRYQCGHEDTNLFLHAQMYEQKLYDNHRRKKLSCTQNFYLHMIICVVWSENLLCGSARITSKIQLHNGAAKYLPLTSMQCLRTIIPHQSAGEAHFPS